MSETCVALSHNDISCLFRKCYISSCATASVAVTTTAGAAVTVAYCTYPKIPFLNAVFECGGKLGSIIC